MVGHGEDTQRNGKSVTGTEVRRGGTVVPFPYPLSCGLFSLRFKRRSLGGIKKDGSFSIMHITNLRVPNLRDRTRLVEDYLTPPGCVLSVVIRLL